MPNEGDFMEEVGAEDESMANIDPPKLARATGSTGGNAIQDSSARGLIAAALGGILAFLQIEFNLLSTDGVAALVPVTLFIAFVLGGLWDKFVKGRLMSS